MELLPALVTTAELKIISVGTIPAVLKELAPIYERMSGNAITMAFGNPLVTIERLRKGEPADVVIFSPRIADDLVKENWIDMPADAIFAKSRVGMAILASARRPPFGTKDEFISAMRNAQTIGLLDPKAGSGTSPPVLDAFQELGLMQELSPKIRLFQGTGEQIGEAIARGEVEVGFSAISEFIFIKNVQIVGPIPSEVVSYVSFLLAAVAKASSQPDAAASFVRFLHSREAQPIFMRYGVAAE